MPKTRSAKYLVVQPYGRDKGRDATLVYEAQTAEEAFAEIDRLAGEMMRTGAPSDAVEFLVTDEERRIVRRRAN